MAPNHELFTGRVIKKVRNIAETPLIDLSSHREDNKIAPQEEENLRMTKLDDDTSSDEGIYEG